MAAGFPVQVRLAHEELGALDSYRREKLNPPSRGQALRELARIALSGKPAPAEPRSNKRPAAGEQPADNRART